MHIVKEETGKRPQPTTWPNTWTTPPTTWAPKDEITHYYANGRLAMMTYPYQVQDIPIYQVRVTSLHPPLGPRDFARIAVLSESMKAVGQLEPIQVSERLSDGSYRVVHGQHRLEAAKRLGWQTIRCYVRTNPFDVLFSPGAAFERFRRMWIQDFPT